MNALTTATTWRKARKRLRRQGYGLSWRMFQPNDKVVIQFDDTGGVTVSKLTGELLDKFKEAKPGQQYILK